jgi:hypothetical protein
MGQLIQMAGALLVLAGFALAQAGRIDAASRGYLVLNLVGSSVLAVEAYLGAQWGFLLLEAAWAAVTRPWPAPVPGDRRLTRRSTMMSA